MNPLSSYLEKFKILLKDSTEKKKIISEAISSTLHIPLAVENITVKDNTIYISSSPSMKNELFIHRKSICEGLEKSLKQTVVIR